MAMPVPVESPPAYSIVQQGVEESRPLAIHTQNLTRRYGAITAVDAIDLNVREGRSTGSWDRTARAKPPRCGCCSG